MLHILRATKETVHWGYFDAALAPALMVKSGDYIHVQAITHHAGDAPDLMMDVRSASSIATSRRTTAIPASTS